MLLKYCGLILEHLVQRSLQLHDVNTYVSWKRRKSWEKWHCIPRCINFRAKVRVVQYIDGYLYLTFKVEKYISISTKIKQAMFSKFVVSQPCLQCLVWHSYKLNNNYYVTPFYAGNCLHYYMLNLKLHHHKYTNLYFYFLFIQSYYYIQ